VKVQFAYEDDEVLDPWKANKRNGESAPCLERRLRFATGRVSTEAVDATPGSVDMSRKLKLLYLPAERRPLENLAGKDAALIVELLRSAQQKRSGSKSLAGLHRKTENLLKFLFDDPLVNSVEADVTAGMTALTSGVLPQYPFLGNAVVDDDFLARVFEFVIAASDSRAVGQRIEVSGLGYANLLQLAVVLAAIPDLRLGNSGEDGGDANMESDASSDAATSTMEAAIEESEAEEDAIFPPQFHVTVVVEEPEAHLHPQLQHALIRHLKSVVERRPELQVVVTSHSNEIVSACDPADLVVFRSTLSGRVCRTIKTMNIDAKPEALRMARRHLDASRSAALFADRLVLVEGITDASVLRAFGRRWAAVAPERGAFIDALTITVIGSRVGSWMPNLLVTPGTELVAQLAVLLDQDSKPIPAWVATHRGPTFDAFINVPTLEPSLAVPGNETLIRRALGWGTERAVTPASVHTEFQGRGRSGKAAFADEIVDLLAKGEPAVIPQHFSDLFEFLWDGFAIGVQIDAPPEEPTAPNDDDFRAGIFDGDEFGDDPDDEPF